MNPCNKQLRCPQVYKAANGGIFRAWRKGCAPSNAAQQLSLSAPHPYQHRDPQSGSPPPTLLVSDTSCLQWLLFSALKIPFYTFQEPSSHPSVQMADYRWREQGLGESFLGLLLGSLLELGGRLSLAQTRLCCTAKALQSLSTVFLNALFVFKQICLKPFSGLCFPGAYFIQSTPYKAAESQ